MKSGVNISHIVIGHRFYSQVDIHMRQNKNDDKLQYVVYLRLTLDVNNQLILFPEMNYAYWDTTLPDTSTYVQVKGNKIRWTDLPEKGETLNMGMIKELTGDDLLEGKSNNQDIDDLLWKRAIMKLSKK